MFLIRRAKWLSNWILRLFIRYQPGFVHYRLLRILLRSIWLIEKRIWCVKGRKWWFRISVILRYQLLMIERHYFRCRSWLLIIRKLVWIRIGLFWLSGNLWNQWRSWRNMISTVAMSLISLSDSQTLTFMKKWSNLLFWIKAKEKEALLTTFWLMI